MIDQKSILSGERNPIMDLVNHEKSIQEINIEQPVTVRLAGDGKTLLLKHGSVELHGDVNRPLMHQLGGRAWGSDKEFGEIEGIWYKKFSKNHADLEYELASVFRKNDLSIRYDTNDKGENTIYGIVTPHFVDVNQLEFRQNFLEKIRTNTTIVPKSDSIVRSKFGQVTEFFKFDTPGFQTTYKYGLVYAKNNGYEAYKATWGRLILCCTNGLTVWEGEKKFRWKHTREIILDDFIMKTIKEGMENQLFIERRIALSLETELKQSLLTELMGRLSLPQASKNRLLSRLDIESNSVRRNEWALSQALTWLGTHKSGIAFNSKPKLTALGTGILEKSLDKTLHNKVHVDRRGDYGLMLPKDMGRPAHA